MKARWASAALVVTLVTQSGCYDWVAVAPVDATKLRGSFVTEDGQSVAVRTVNVEQPDGRMVQLHGNYRIRVTLKDGATYEFSPPVDVRETDGAIVFRGGDEAPLRANADDVVGLAATKPNHGKTAALATALGIVGLALTIAMIVALANSVSSIPVQ